MSDILRILEQRENTHGDFNEQSKTSQSIKKLLRQNKDLQTNQKEALDLIATKLARITHGNHNEVDHWNDIAGYATLVAKDL